MTIEPGRHAHQGPPHGLPTTRWAVIAYALTVLIGILALLITRQPSAVGDVISPLLMPLGWLLGQSMTGDSTARGL